MAMEPAVALLAQGNEISVVIRSEAGHQPFIVGKAVSMMHMARQCDNAARVAQLADRMVK